MKYLSWKCLGLLELPVLVTLLKRNHFILQSKFYYVRRSYPKSSNKIAPILRDILIELTRLRVSKYLYKNQFLVKRVNICNP